MNTATIQPVTQQELTNVAISAIIARAASRARGTRMAKRLLIKERAMAEIDRLNPTPDEYEAAIKLLTEALKI